MTSLRNSVNLKVERAASIWSYTIGPDAGHDAAVQRQAVQDSESLRMISKSDDVWAMLPSALAVL